MKKKYVFRIVLVICTFFLVFQFVVKPIMPKYNENVETDGIYWSDQLSSDRTTDYDVIVYGAEPQGISAALSSARLGARTLLISQTENAGGIITNCMIPELEVPVNQKGEILNGGILVEMNSRLGDSFSSEKYIATVNEMLKAEGNLKVLYNTSIKGVTRSGTYLEALQLLTKEGEKNISSRMFIDASDDGALLEASKVPYINGSGDLNMEDSYIPVSLNFEMKDITNTGNKADAINRLLRSSEFYSKLQKYKTLNKQTRVDRIHVFFIDANRVIISGLEISRVNVLDKKELEEGFLNAVEEAKNLSLFLSDRFEEFGSYQFTKTAETLRIRESRHYRGIYTLTVNDILDSEFFTDTVAMGSYPVQIGKFAVRGSFIAGKGAQYGIPIGCIVPERTSNLLMAGPVISYSSLAASSAGTIGTGIATGEAAGAAAVYCAARNEIPVNLNPSHEKYSEFESILIGKKMFLPNDDMVNQKVENWAYPAARKLLSLGLIAGGEKNDLQFEVEAEQKDLAFILINGIYRVDKDAYTMDLDARLRPFITNDSLTYDSTVRMLGALYGYEDNTDVLFKKLQQQNRINKVMQLKLDKSRILTMEETYYLGIYSIMNYTGKDIPD